MLKLNGSGLLLSTLWSVVILSLLYILITVGLEESISQKSLFNNVRNKMLVEEQIDAYLSAKIDLTEQSEIYPDNCSGNLKTALWGGFELIQSSITTETDTVSRAYLIGSSSNESGLYLTDLSKRITFSQHVSLNGHSNIPRNLIQTVPSNDTNDWRWKSTFSPSTGWQKGSGDKLKTLTEHTGRIADQTEELLSVLQETDFTWGEGQIWYNGFNFRVKEVYQDTLKNENLHGRYIWYTRKPIFIDSTCTLNGAWVIGENIEIGDGLIGSGHLTATAQLKVGDRVELAYPSSMGVVRSYTRAGLEFGASKIEGVVLGLNLTKNDNAVLDSDCEIVGDMVWQGKAELGGMFKGTCLISEVFTENTSYFRSDAVTKFIVDPEKRSPFVMGIGSGKGSRVKKFVL